MQECDQCPSSEVNCDKTQSLISQAQNSIQESYNLLAEKLTESQDKKMAAGVLKFTSKLQRLIKSNTGSGNLISALFNFGMSELSKSKNGKKIKVQPNRKRKSGNGSRQAVGKQRSFGLEPLVIPKKKAKRSHNFSVAMRENTPMAKKSGSHTMKSKTSRT